MNCQAIRRIPLDQTEDGRVWSAPAHCTNQATTTRVVWEDAHDKDNPNKVTVHLCAECAGK